MKVVSPFEPTIRVRDLERSVRFYRDVLEMKIFSIDDITADQSSRASLAPSGYRMARLDTEGGDRLKLAEPVGMAYEPQAPSEFVLGRPGFAYLSYIVPDIQDTIARLKGAGAPIRTGQEPVTFRPGVSIIFAEDPDGNVLEFIERHDLDRYRPQLHRT